MSDPRITLAVVDALQSIGRDPMKFSGVMRYAEDTDTDFFMRLLHGIAAKARNALAQIDKERPEFFQARVAPWMQATFGPEISADGVERGDRLVEELYELLQSVGYDRARLSQIEAYTWGRPPGEPSQEVGGVMVTLAAFCLAHGLHMHDAGETELVRVWTKVETIRAKQAAKPKLSPLPAAVERPEPTLEAENERLRVALVEIRDMEDRPYEGPHFDSDAVAACPECQRYKGHPIQHGICDEHRRPFYARERHDAFERGARGSRASSIARAALSGDPK